MSKHTPGPWAVDPKRSLRVITKTEGYWPKDGYTVATTGCDEEQRASWEANACLIAAAPEALAFAESFVEWLDTIRKVRDPKQMMPGIEAREREARAFIAKARGES